MGFSGPPGTAYVEIPQTSSSDVLRMTDFGFAARGHARHLLKTRRQNNIEANKKQILLRRPRPHPPP
jgi:hypothetical protein